MMMPALKFLVLMMVAGNELSRLRFTLALLTDWLPSGRWNPKAKLREGRFVRRLPVEEVTRAEALREGGHALIESGVKSCPLPDSAARIRQKE